MIQDIFCSDNAKVSRGQQQQLLPTIRAARVPTKRPKWPFLIPSQYKKYRGIVTSNDRRLIRSINTYDQVIYDAVVKEFTMDMWQDGAA
jgi:hypothetical protein